jgi:hypothetical protein
MEIQAAGGSVDEINKRSSGLISESGAATVGQSGGQEQIDAFPQHHRRRRNNRILEHQAGGEENAAIAGASQRGYAEIRRDIAPAGPVHVGGDLARFKVPAQRGDLKRGAQREDHHRGEQSGEIFAGQ